jgi:hypothetical protein
LSAAQIAGKPKLTKQPALSSCNTTLVTQKRAYKLVFDSILLLQVCHAAAVMPGVFCPAAGSESSHPEATAAATTV